ncbi:hypothetical protein OXIME_000586 [Oxyplasma meridianum]|uniref:Uncharacterized protein n=1 Tax=Oxyplasma meridianum TaxID=3073602 RepID=A0AAX4NFX4_9ARCH
MNMRHASVDEVERIQIILKELRNIDGIRENQIGHFYFKGKNVIHFHTHQDDIYADIGDTRIKLTLPMDTVQIAEILNNVNQYMIKIAEERRKH